MRTSAPASASRPATRQPATPATAPKRGSYTAARRAAREAALRRRSIKHQLVRGRKLITLAALRRPTESRWPFVAVFAAIAAVAVITLLMLNTATAQSSFTKRQLTNELSALTLQQQQLAEQVAHQESPQALAAQAAALGMIPGSQPGYAVVNEDGTVTWVEPPPPLVPPPPPAAAPAPADPAPADPAPAAQAGAEDPAAQQPPASPPVFVPNSQTDQDSRG